MAVKPELLNVINNQKSFMDSNSYHFKAFLSPSFTLQLNVGKQKVRLTVDLGGGEETCRRNTRATTTTTAWLSEQGRENTTTSSDGRFLQFFISSKQRKNQAALQAVQDVKELLLSCRKNAGNFQKCDLELLLGCRLEETVMWRQRS